jgi:hypothetical protein
VILLENGPGGSGNDDDEGAAMAEIIHDLAPGASITFYSRGNTEASMAQAIDALRNCGVDIIVDDAFFVEPMFQDGPLRRRSTAVTWHRVLAVAGNQATYGVDQVYQDIHPVNDTNFPATGNYLHDFGEGNSLPLLASLQLWCASRFAME